MAVKYSYADDPWQPATSRDELRIRLIELQPSTDANADLDARIYWTSLAAPAVSFNALSYTWGNNVLTRRIRLHGKELGITESLDSALRHLRSRSESITLWIDQLCIDQSSDIEKTEQVSCMGDIYGAATEVLVWLGPAADDSDLAMLVFSEVGQAADAWGMQDYDTSEKSQELLAIMLGVDTQHAKSQSYADMSDNAISRFTPQAIQAMAAWYQRPWFTRVWVVQEFCLARSAVFACGSRTVRSEHVTLTKRIFNASITKPALLQHAMVAMSAFQSLVQDPTAAFTAIRERRRWFNQGSGTGDGLYQLLKRLYVENAMQATEACDTIYSLLSLATDTSSLGIKPDYTLKSQVPVILAIAIKQIIIAQGDLECLSLSQFPKKHQGLPSWVPDWTNALRYPFAWQSQADKPLFRPSLHRQLQTEQTESNLALALKGHLVDTITDLAPSWPPKITPSSTTTFSFQKYAALLDDIQNVCTIASKKPTPLLPDVSPRRRAEALWRVPIGDIEHGAGAIAVRASTAQAAIHAVCLQQIAFQQRQQTPMSAAEVASFEAQLEQQQPQHKWATSQYYARMDAMQCKRAFATAGGLVGMAPAHAERGDVVVLLYGAELPFVLRRGARAGQGEEEWQLVGECYCDGIMDGEAVDVNPSRWFIIT